MLELCQMVDEAGFHAIWIGEHHGMNFTISPNPFLHLVDLARRTQRVRLGTATIVAPFWHPIKLAGEAAMTDLLTDGRLELGLARGAYVFEYERLYPGLDARSAGQHLREMVVAVRGLWKGNYVHQGECWDFPSTTAVPKPLQVGGPPLWIAARDPDSHVFALANGCHVQVTPLWQGDEQVAALMTRFKRACALYPEERQAQIMVLRHTIVSEEEEALEQGARELSRFYHYFNTWFQNRRPINQGSLLPLSEVEMAENEDLSPANMRVNNVIGLPGEVTARLRYYEALGFNEYVYWIDNTSSFAAKRRSLQCFIEKVLPNFRSGEEGSH